MSGDGKGASISPEQLINQILQAASRDIDALEEQIDKLPKDKGYDLAPRPSWMGPSRSINQVQENKEVLRKQQEAIRIEAKGKIAEISKTIDEPETQERISAKMELWEERSGQSESAYLKKLEPFERSQSFAKTLLYEARYGEGGVNPVSSSTNEKTHARDDIEPDYE